MSKTQQLLEATGFDVSEADYTSRRSGDSSSAVVDVSYPDGTEETYVLIAEEGEWRVDADSEDADR